MNLKTNPEKVIGDTINKVFTVHQVSEKILIKIAGY